SYKLMARAKSPEPAFVSASLSCCACFGVIMRSQPVTIIAITIHNLFRCIVRVIIAALQPATRKKEHRHSCVWAQRAFNLLVLLEKTGRNTRLAQQTKKSMFGLDCILSEGGRGSARPSAERARGGRSALPNQSR